MARGGRENRREDSKRHKGYDQVKRGKKGQRSYRCILIKNQCFSARVDIGYAEDALSSAYYTSTSFSKCLCAGYRRGSLEYKVGFWGYNGDFQRSSVNDKWDVVLVSDKLKIGLLDVLPPLAFLHQVQINLTESSGWLLESSKRAPTKQEFKNVLSKLSGIWIRGGYYAGGEELKGSEGVLGFDSKTLYFLSKNTMQPRSVPFSDITSVDVGSDDIVQIYGPNHRVVMTAGRFTSYNVSQLAKFFETVRKKTDEVKKGSDRANDRGKDSPKYDGRGSKQESSTKNVEGQEQKRRQTAPDEQGQTFQEKQERETEKKRPKKQAQYEEEHEDIATETPKHERTSKIHKHTENLPRDNFDDANIKSLQYQFLSGTERKRVLKMEKELDINSRAIYKRLEGGGGLLLLTSDALIIIPADPDGKKKNKKTSLHKITLDNLISVEREGSFVEIYDKRKNDPIRVNIKHFPFQELMDLLDDIAKIMRLV
ncbi:hypothetical protein GUITHDRAFT_162590 [Guillardia theta CCMP2712]|uniref:Uncharacterized protein n=1 Tax=Guillardia theta (strain CCMP2712) TaxID=905079 RepID=L1JI60_GUITC|nr:hypothetical protein GUITHDRAFT_162590 [Guillardia theta CCMP2712]EKX47819.1 hypothetical protein GUITHDRAFT_162590 [Guillardia theta CCMP2712]|eukprot:XP_005834799.1 hypothetical protein GUITHDRAFT_162590 [Guillardia theta CCMP2712]